MALQSTDRGSSAESESSNTTSTSSADSSTSTVSFAQALGLNSNNNNDENDNGGDASVPVGLYWDEWSRCMSSGFQSDSLYRHGKLDGCGKQWKDLKIAAEARLVQWRDPQRAERLIESTYYKKRTTISPTAGAIWELKETPGWN